MCATFNNRAVGHWFKSQTGEMAFEGKVCIFIPSKEFCILTMYSTYSGVALTDMEKWYKAKVFENLVCISHTVMYCPGCTMAFTLMSTGISPNCQSVNTLLKKNK